MALPTIRVLVNWSGAGWGAIGPYDDVTADVNAPAGSALLVAKQGVSLDGRRTEKGSLTLTLDNVSGRYSVGNPSSPIVNSLLPGRAVHVIATYSGTVYPIFAGYIRRIVPNGPDRKVQILAEDVLFRYDRAEVSVAQSASRSLYDLRGLILDAAAESSTRRVLPHGVEDFTVSSGADQQSAFDALQGIGEASGSIQFIRPHALETTFYQYVVKDRMQLLDQAAAESIAAVDIESFDNYDVTDEALINQQRVTPAARSVASGEVQLWTASGRIDVAANKTATVWASWSDPVATEQADQVRIDYAATGSGSVALVPFTTSAKITIIAGASGMALDNLTIYGRPLVPIDARSVVALDSASVTKYGAPPWQGSDLSSALLPNEAHAQGRADGIVYRYGTHRARPSVTRFNKFPQMFQREPGDVISVDNGQHNIAGMLLQIAGRTLTLYAGGSWRAQYDCEQVPVALTWAKLDTAGRGLNQGILGY